jgi:hypothetical protein
VRHQGQATLIDWVCNRFDTHKKQQRLISPVFEAELSIPWDALPNFCFMERAKKLGAEHACLVRVDSLARQGDRLRHLVEVRGKDTRRLVNVLAAPGIRSSPHAITSASYLNVVETPICPLYETISSTSCFLVKETVQKEYLSWDVIGESASVVNFLLRKLKRSGVNAKMVRIEKINGGKRLTDRQEQVLRLAYDCGFFESPHKTSVRQLAKALDCSPSTLVRILRIAEKKALSAKFGQFPNDLSNKIDSAHHS